MIRDSLALGLGSLLILAAIDCHDAHAQTSNLDESVTVESYGQSEATGKAFICPGNVPVGERAVRFAGTVTTTSESGISYQVTIQYGSGEAPAVRSSIGT